MSAPMKIDAQRLTLMLKTLRLPATTAIWPAFAERADKEGWPASRFLAALAEHEVAERDRRRIERHLDEARLLAGKTLDSFDFQAVPMLSQAHVTALSEDASWVDRGSNVLMFGPPGGGKSHLASALGFALVERVQLARSPVTGNRRSASGVAFSPAQAAPVPPSAAAS